MNDTQKRIRKYKEMLPHLKEKVAAVSVLLAMSATMLTTVSFAWLTLSKSPEVSDVATSIAANGNLEIALVGAEGKIPSLSEVGDSNKSLIERNITWGNLVNLSDPNYGLDNLVLRPAQLNTAGLLTNPLYGAEYDKDGRVIKLNSDFGFATWVPSDGVKPGQFVASEDYGVRAISSVTYDYQGQSAVFNSLLKEAGDANLLAVSTYTSLASNTNYMQSLATMMGLYMTARMNPDEASLNNPECDVKDIQNLRDMYSLFLDCFYYEADAIAKLVNVHRFLKYGESFTPCTREEVIAAKNDAGLRALIGSTNSSEIVVTRFSEFIKDYNTISSDLEKLKEISESGSALTWKDSGLNNIVNNLVNVGACTIGADNTPISSIGASNAMGYLSGTQEARITNGILYRFEERTGGYIDVKSLSISAKVKRMGITVPATVKANVQTTASRDYNIYTQDLNTVKNKNNGNFVGGNMVANDTYGLAVDLWVRTNAAGSYLTLQGNVLTDTQIVRAMGKDENGNDVELYTLTLNLQTEEGTTEESYDAYKIGNTWYHAQTHRDLTEDLASEIVVSYSSTEKMEEITTVIGYEGENRVWDESVGLSVNSTTQGSGSCYVYYADTPEDQERSLKLLAGMKVVFVSEDGKRLATAEMDTAHFYAQNGKVIVPLVLSSDSMVIGYDTEGNPIYAIASLEQNVATRITAIIYLDGTLLSNEDVLSSADIQGKLNIQFGSSAKLNSLNNEKLEGEEIHVSAAITGKTQFDYGLDDDLTTQLAVTVLGSEPQRVTAFFVRAINTTQGSREEEMVFTYNSNTGKWETNYTFKSPGNYILRSVQLDGVDYDLDNAELPKVTIEGFNIGSLTWDVSLGDYVEVKTANTSVSTNLQMTFASHDIDKMPKTVEGRFIHSEDKSAVSVKFTYNATQDRWEGKANFLKSGNYVMEYVVLDGEYTSLPASMVKTIKINLGMKVEVYTTSPHTFKYLPGGDEWADNMENLYMRIRILDDTGAEMQGWDGVQLYYRRKGSTKNGLDVNLKWNSSTKYYEGVFSSEPGVFEFSRVEVYIGDTVSVISRADTSPVFTIMSPEPPSYDSVQYSGYQYSPEGKASVNVLIKQSSAASVKAYFKNLNTGEVLSSDGNGYATEDDEATYIWNFVVPKDNDGNQDGKWQLMYVELADVYDASGMIYTEEAPMVMDLENKNIITTVLQTIVATFGDKLSKEYGKDANGNVTGAFMQSYNIEGMNVTITDGSGNAIKLDEFGISVKDVVLTFTYTNGSSQEKGGYTSSSLTNATSGATISIPLADSGDGKKFVQSETKQIVYAGEYTATLSFKVGNNVASGYSVSGMPTMTVWSVAPNVKITAAQYSNKSGGTSTITDGTSTTVYYKEGTEKSCGVTYYNYTPADVTITLSGYGNANSARLVFTTSNSDGKVHLYEESQKDDGTSTNQYTWSGNGTCKRYMGYWESKTGTDDKTPAGTLTATTLVLTYGGMDFNVAVNIIINNPS